MFDDDQDNTNECLCGRQVAKLETVVSFALKWNKEKEELVLVPQEYYLCKDCVTRAKTLLRGEYER